MKVLVFIEQSAPSRYWEAALPMLRERGVDASFVTLRRPGPLTDELISRDITVHDLGACVLMTFVIGYYCRHSFSRTIVFFRQVLAW